MIVVGHVCRCFFFGLFSLVVCVSLLSLMVTSCYHQVVGYCLLVFAFVVVFVVAAVVVDGYCCCCCRCCCSCCYQWLLLL